MGKRGEGEVAGLSQMQAPVDRFVVPPQWSEIPPCRPGAKSAALEITPRLGLSDTSSLQPTAP